MACLASCWVGAHGRIGPCQLVGSHEETRQARGNEQSQEAATTLAWPSGHYMPPPPRTLLDASASRGMGENALTSSLLFLSEIPKPVPASFPLSVHVSACDCEGRAELLMHGNL